MSSRKERRAKQQGRQQQQQAGQQQAPEFNAGYRVAIRQEGRLVNAYWTPVGTMATAQVISCIPAELASRAPKLYECWFMVVEAMARDLLQPLLEPGQNVSRMVYHEPNSEQPLPPRAGAA